jgi:hypothetical protein
MALRRDGAIYSAGLGGVGASFAAMRAIAFAALACLAGLGGCARDSWLTASHLLVDGFDETNQDCRTGLCDHDENTDLASFGSAIYLVHRTAESQVLGPNSSLHVYRSTDEGSTFDLLAVIPAPSDRDLRDPCFYTIGGQLAIKAITRLPVSSTRDSNVDSITVNTVSPDGGTTWGALTPIGPPMWSFWRVHRSSDGTYYSAAYQDGDQSVSLFSSTDGQTWAQGAQIYGVSTDTPLETELAFLPSGNLLALVRTDGSDAQLLGNVAPLRTKVCTAAPPYGAFDCSNELDGARLDGPVGFFYDHRLFVIARFHFLDVSDRKRTDLYEIEYDSETGPFRFVDHGHFPSAGDTSYAGVVPLGADDTSRFLVSYYSSNIPEDPAWASAMFEATDIWTARIDLANL